MIANRARGIEYFSTLAHRCIEQPRIGDVIHIKRRVFAHHHRIIKRQWVLIFLNNAVPIGWLRMVFQNNALGVGLDATDRANITRHTRPNLVTTRLRRLHHSVGGFFNDFEFRERIGDKKNIHGMVSGMGFNSHNCSTLKINSGLGCGDGLVEKSNRWF